MKESPKFYLLIGPKRKIVFIKIQSILKQRNEGRVKRVPRFFIFCKKEAARHYKPGSVVC